VDKCRQLAGKNRRKARGHVKDTGTFKFLHLNKHIAYLLGAYMTDGCISENGKGWQMFTLEVIDQDFAEHVQEAINALTEQKHGSIFIRESRGKQLYKAYTGNQELCEWLQKATFDKQIIPDAIWEATPELQKAFVAGAMDGDGWICVGQRGDRESRLQFNIGFANSSPWTHDLVAMLRKLGAKIGKVGRQREGADRWDGKPLKPLYRFTINIGSFVDSGLHFTIQRKRDRVKLWLDKVRSSETEREASVRDEVTVRSA
jgi:hypothetical protein